MVKISNDVNTIVFSLCQNPKSLVNTGCFIYRPEDRDKKQELTIYFSRHLLPVVP